MFSSFCENVLHGPHLSVVCAAVGGEICWETRGRYETLSSRDFSNSELELVVRPRDKVFVCFWLMRMEVCACFNVIDSLLILFHRSVKYSVGSQLLVSALRSLCPFALVLFCLF